MRAIILAAGMGTRLQPLTFATPKSLVRVNGKPILERQIECLKEIGIEQIIVVTGYMHKQFEYLKGKYGVTLVQNDQYEQYNNIFSMYLVRNYLPDSYVLEADVFLNHNFLEKKPATSKYFSARKPEFKNEWMLRFDEHEQVLDIEVGNGRNEYILCGVSYWTERDANFIIEKLEQTIANGNFKSLFWDDIVIPHLKELNVYLHEINPDDSYEIDSQLDLELVNSLVKN